MKRIRLERDGIPRVRQRLVDAALIAEVSPLIDEVYQQGDQAILTQRRRFDGVEGQPLRVNREALLEAEAKLEGDERAVLRDAIERVRRFARKQWRELRSVSWSMGRGIRAGQRLLSVDSAALYVPGGRFPLPSSLIMGAVPAQVAGVKRLAVFTPPRFQGRPHPLVLACAELLGIDEVYAIGGVTAIAAAAYGSETVPAVDLIVGPGNRYVTAAKKLVYGDVGIDALAGPSELLVVADESVPASWVAADLLSQAEHDPEARVILFCRCEGLADAVERELEMQLNRLPDPTVARKALSCGAVVLYDSPLYALRAIDDWAPEHLELLVANPAWWRRRLRHYGTLFIGPYSVEALADYCAGPNHTLPTARSARFSSGLSVRNFVKLSTTLAVNKAGFERLGPTALRLSELEGLMAHRASLTYRVDSVVLEGPCGKKM